MKFCKMLLDENNRPKKQRLISLSNPRPKKIDSAKETKKLSSRTIEVFKPHIKLMIKSARQLFQDECTRGNKRISKDQIANALLNIDTDQDCETILTVICEQRCR